MLGLFSLSHRKDVQDLKDQGEADEHPPCDPVRFVQGGVAARNIDDSSEKASHGPDRHGRIPQVEGDPPYVAVQGGDIPD